MRDRVKNMSFRRRLSRTLAIRIAGAVVFTAGLALMGIGTISSPVTGGNFKGVVTTVQTIVSISENCTNGTTTGTLTVLNPVAGDTVTLEVYAHSIVTGDWVATGATDIITMVANQTTYSYSISNIPSQYLDTSVYNTLRVQVYSTTGTFAGTTTKGVSYVCGTATTTTSTALTTSSKTLTTTTTSTATTTAPGSSTTSTATTGTTVTTTKTTTSTSPGSTTTVTVTSPTTSTVTSSGTTTTTVRSTTTSPLTTTVTQTTTVTAPASSASSSSSSTSSATPGSSTTPSTTTTASHALGISTTTPVTGSGSDWEFGVGIALLTAGGGLVAGAGRIARRKKH